MSLVKDFKPEFGEKAILVEFFTEIE